MNDPSAHKNSPMLRRIRDAVESVGGDSSVRVRVSVAAKPVWERSPGNDDQVLVRWACWSIERGEHEVFPAQFEPLSQHVTEGQLRLELPDLLPGVEVVVDDDIDV